MKKIAEEKLTPKDEKFLTYLAEYIVIDCDDAGYIYGTKDYYKKKIKRLSSLKYIAVKEIRQIYETDEEKKLKRFLADKKIQSNPGLNDYLQSKLKRIQRTVEEDKAELKSLSKLLETEADIQGEKLKKYLESEKIALEKEYQETKSIKVIHLLGKGREAALKAGSKLIRELKHYDYDTVYRLRNISRLAVKLSTMGILVLETEYESLKETSAINKLPLFMQSCSVKKFFDGLDYQSRMHGLLISQGGNYAIYNIAEMIGRWEFKKENTVMDVDIKKLSKESFSGSKSVDGIIILLDSLNEEQKIEEIFFPQNSKKDIDLRFPKCYMLPNSDEGFDIIRLMTKNDWKKTILKLTIPEEEIEKSEWPLADCKWNGKYAVIMVNNCMITKKNIIYQSQNSPTSIKSNIEIICLANQKQYLEETFLNKIK